jgi:hypothetical protein
MHNICEYWFEKDQSRIRDLRPDSLSQVLTLGNIHPGGRYLVVDDASGILISSVLDRLGGKFILFACNYTNSSIIRKWTNPSTVRCGVAASLPFHAIFELSDIHHGRGIRCVELGFCRSKLYARQANFLLLRYPRLNAIQSLRRRAIWRLSRIKRIDKKLAEISVKQQLRI